MLHRLPLLAAALVCLPALADDAKLPMTAPPATGEYETLFDGQTLDGWRGDERLWEVRDGVIHGETTPQKPAKGNTFLIWKGPVEDFELRLSFKCNATNNSGIMYRAGVVENGPNPYRMFGYQHEVRNEVDFPDVPGFIYDEAGKRTRMCGVGEQVVYTAEGKNVLRDDLISQAEFRDLMKLDEFNEVVIRAQGNRIQHWLNGRLLVDFTDEHPKAFDSGLIGLQLHAGKPMFAEFKDIELKRL